MERNGTTTLIHEQIQQLRVSNAILRGESDMFERFMERRDPQELLEPQEQQQPELQTGGARRLTADGMLTLRQKLHIAQQEVKETQQEKEKLKQKFDRIIDGRKASWMEADVRQAEIRKSRSQFERNLVSFMGSSRRERTDAERLVCCIQDGSKVTKLETLNQKNVALRLKVKNLLQQLKQKKERHEKADLEVPLLDQEEAAVKTNITEMKRRCRQGQRDICSHMGKVRRSTAESSELDSLILKRTQMLAHLEEKTQHAENERLRAEAQQQRLRRQLEDFQVPDVSEYMRAKAKLRKLQAAVHSTDRKVAVAERTLKTWTTEWIKPGDPLKAAADAGHDCQENPNEAPKNP
ncbi:coiled-coil domain-containing protein 113 [Oryzias latipes]|uniref:coiled-coil domain-containing protein 113 n=1 Tax=Oryzias latipes TaxID=8090 RepID=UPI000CE1A0C4|nr:coiled-coil domain-containing protein 113 [Oryzias latipes]XP_023811877.1 coiled-coil domain-containing protein 113 [Oryzias latipes]